jgi:hypothetical protein
VIAGQAGDVVVGMLALAGRARDSYAIPADRIAEALPAGINDDLIEPTAAEHETGQPGAARETQGRSLIGEPVLLAAAWLGRKIVTW